MTPILALAVLTLLPAVGAFGFCYLIHTVDKRP